MTPNEPEADALATYVCARSDEHTAGAGRHDAQRYGPCSDHERIVAETLAALRPTLVNPASVAAAVAGVGPRPLIETTRSQSAAHAASGWGVPRFLLADASEGATHPMPVAKRVELREMVAALDTCLCGDYRHQHVAEVGACMLCDTPGCGGFRMDQEAVIRWEAR